MKNYIIVLFTACLLSGCNNASVTSTPTSASETVSAKQEAVYISDQKEICAFIKKIGEDSIQVDIAEYLTDEDTGRIKELNLSEGDLPDGYYIYNPEIELETFALAPDTVFNFIDWGRDFVKSDNFDDLKISTTNRDDFIKYLNTYENSEPGMPFFLEFKDGKVTSITEKPMA